MALTKVKTGVVDSSVFAANKNVIINGNLDIWQRGTTITAPASTDYTADRWEWTVGGGGVGVVDIKRSANVPDGESDHALFVDVTTLDASIGAGDAYLIGYKVEGYDAQRFGFGTSDAKVLTLSFWIRSGKTGIHCVAFRNAATDRSYVVEYTVNTINTWEYKTVTLTADTTGTWLSVSSLGLNITWALAVGSNFQGVANTWNAANDVATSNQVNVMDNALNNFLISRVQLEVGSVATEFERRSFATELSMCQRYYIDHPDVQYGWVGDATNTEIYRFSVPFPTKMRTAPTVALVNISVLGFATPTVGGSDEDKFQAIATCNTTASARRFLFGYNADAEL